MPLSAFAPAKINLALHVTGRRADGYHLLDSLVAFADVGDRLSVFRATDLRLRVTGPGAAGVPEDRRNLVWQAAEFLAPGRGVDITLHKVLPHAAGIGGGSADAAAALRLLAAHWDVPLPAPEDCLALGADVPVCLAGRAVRMTGIGEDLHPVPELPEAWFVLVNPGRPVPTAPVFQALSEVDNRPLPTPRWNDLGELVGWLHATRNDLQGPARRLVPAIDLALQAVQAQPGCLLSRMSGSGGTCFGLFATQAAAEAAATRIAEAEPGWWIVPARMLGQI